MQLGHLDGGICPLPQNSFNNKFTIIDSDGVHEIAIDYCRCQYSLPKTIQLLCTCLFPSTTIDPKTAATFWVLEMFQMLSFTSKVSGFEYYRSLERWTDNTGTSLPLVGYWFYWLISITQLIQFWFEPLSCFHVDYMRMVPCLTAEENGARSFSVGCKGYTRGRMCSSLSSISNSRGKFACWLEWKTSHWAVHELLALLLTVVTVTIV